MTALHYRRTTLNIFNYDTHCKISMKEINSESINPYRVSEFNDFRNEKPPLRTNKLQRTTNYDQATK